QFSSTGVSLIGTLILGLIFIYFSYLIIASKDIEQTLSKDLANLGKGLRQISLLIARGAVKQAAAQSRFSVDCPKEGRDKNLQPDMKQPRRSPGKIPKKKKRACKRTASCLKTAMISSRMSSSSKL